MKLEKAFENNPKYKEVERLCNALPICLVLRKMLEIQDHVPSEKRLDTLHYELTKAERQLNYEKTRS
jgi:hypothetical protein